MPEEIERIPDLTTPPSPQPTGQGTPSMPDQLRPFAARCGIWSLGILTGLLVLAAASSSKGEPSRAEKARADNERWAAMSQLDETSAMDRVDIFLEALRHDDDPSVRNVAARALKRRGWQPGNLNDTILSAIGLTARAELVRIGTPAVQPMIKAYTNTDSSRYALSWIPYAIAEIGDPRAIPFLTSTVLSGFQQERWPRDPSELTYTPSSNPRLRDDVQASFNGLISLGHPAQEYLASLLADTNRANAWQVADSLLQLESMSVNTAKKPFLSPLMPTLRDMAQQRKPVLISGFGNAETDKLRIPRDLNPLANACDTIPFSEFFAASLHHALAPERFAVQNDEKSVSGGRVIAVSGDLRAKVRVRRAGVRTIDVVTLGIARFFEELNEEREYWGNCQITADVTYRQGSRTMRKNYASKAEFKRSGFWFQHTPYGLMNQTTKEIVAEMVRDLEAFSQGDSHSAVKP